MGSGDINEVLQRMEDAIDRIDTALREGRLGTGPDGTRESEALKARDAALRAAVGGAIARIDMLIGSVEGAGIGSGANGRASDAAAAGPGA